MEKINSSKEVKEVKEVKETKNSRKTSANKESHKNHNKKNKEKNNSNTIVDESREKLTPSLYSLLNIEKNASKEEIVSINLL
jgi:hypothetical protein